MSGSVSEAMKTIKRAGFLPPGQSDDADHDGPVPIGYGQTNSQPMVVQRTLEWLNLEPGQYVLDVGSGSGWTSALIGYLVGKKGSVIAVERVPELVAFGQANVTKAGINNVTFYQAVHQLGWPATAPYDRILVSAEAKREPQELIDQLKPGGKMVIPIGRSIYEIFKTNDGKIKRKRHRGYIFVPLID